MNNLPNFQFKSNTDDHERRERIEQSKLSRLPERTPFRLPELPRRHPLDFDNTPNAKPAVVVAVCAGCGARLDLTDSIQQRFNSCRKCVSIYGRVEAAIEETEKRERKQILEKFIGGAK